MVFEKYFTTETGEDHSVITEKNQDRTTRRLKEMITAENARSRSREITPGPLGLWLERALVGALFLFVIAAPNSIAATQTAWFLGLVFWVLRFAVWPRPKLDRTPLDYPMFSFFLLSGLSSFLSYSPIISIGKLRAACLFTIVYLFAENVRSLRVLRALAIALVAACMVNVFYTFGQYAVGRGVKVYGVTANSPLNSTQLVTEARNSLGEPKALTATGKRIQP